MLHPEGCRQIYHSPPGASIQNVGVAVVDGFRVPLTLTTLQRFCPSSIKNLTDAIGSVFLKRTSRMGRGPHLIPGSSHVGTEAR